MAHGRPRPTLPPRASWSAAQGPLPPRLPSEAVPTWGVLWREFIPRARESLRRKKTLKWHIAGTVGVTALGLAVFLSDGGAGFAERLSNRVALLAGGEEEVRRLASMRARAQRLQGASGENATVVLPSDAAARAGPEPSEEEARKDLLAWVPPGFEERD
ncbi:unnamed protein product [Phaeothamnion confervicola]